MREIVGTSVIDERREKRQNLMYKIPQLGAGSTVERGSKTDIIVGVSLEVLIVDRTAKRAGGSIFAGS